MGWEGAQERWGGGAEHHALEGERWEGAPLWVSRRGQETEGRSPGPRGNALVVVAHHPAQPLDVFKRNLCRQAGELGTRGGGSLGEKEEGRGEASLRARGGRRRRRMKEKTEAVGRKAESGGGGGEGAGAEVLHSPASSSRPPRSQCPACARSNGLSTPAHRSEPDRPKGGKGCHRGYCLRVQGEARGSG